MENKVRLLIAEDHSLVRGAVRMLLDAEPGFEVVGEAANGEEAVELAKKLVPDVVLMDIAMPGLNGAKATRRLKNFMPSMKILVLTRHDEDGYLQQLFAEGADGYVLKQSPSAVLIDAVKKVFSGDNYLDPSLTQNVMSVFSKRNHTGEGEAKELSPRETTTLRLVALGHSIKEIAQQLEINPKTVESAKSSAMHKLGLSTRVQIVHYAIGRGWMKDN